MLKQKSIFIVTILAILVWVTGCSQSDVDTTSTNEAIEVIHGYTLPPEPDKTINNSTLLGIDSNNNGVRDDVEIWILKKYKDKHPIYTEIAMQDGRVRKIVLESPQKAKESFNSVTSALTCYSYYSDCSENNSSIHVDIDITYNQSFEEKFYNTENRKKAHREFGAALSGGSYTIPWCSESKKYCDFNTTKFEQLP